MAEASKASGSQTHPPRIGPNDTVSPFMIFNRGLYIYRFNRARSILSLVALLPSKHSLLGRALMVKSLQQV